MIRKALVAAAVAVAVLASSPLKADWQPLEADPDEINFGIISTESTTNLKRQWLPFLEDMEEQMGMTVNPFFAPDYAGVIEAMRFGKVTVAWFGNKSAMEAVDRAGAEIFAQQVKTDGTIGYYSVVLVPKNSPIDGLDDLLACDGSLDFGMGDPNSTSGFLVPSFYVFAENGADPKTCFKTVRNANHETNLMAVANEMVDAATNNSEQMARAKKSAPEAYANIREIWRSPLIPGDPITYRHDLSREFKDRIRAFFLAYGRIGPNAEAERQVLAGISDGLGPFHNSDNRQLYPIRQLALFKDKIKLENDDRLDADEKQAKIAEIDGKLGVLAVLAADN